MDIPTLIGLLTGILAIFIPIMAGLVQYRHSVEQDKDKNFRAEVEKLTSTNREERLAAATNMGTFIIKGNRFYNEAIDILIHRTAVELDYNVLSAMVVSLRKVEDRLYPNIIQKVLDIDRNFFIRRYPLKKWRDQSERELQNVQADYKSIEETYKSNQLQVYQSMLENLKKELDGKWQYFLEKDKDYTELNMHTQAITDFISSFLGVVSKSSSISGLEFNQNSLNNAVMESTRIVNSKIKASAFSASQMKETIFRDCNIVNTVFTFSTMTNGAFRNCKIDATLFDQTGLINTDFQGCELNDVFFVGSDLTGANFKNTRGLKPENFFMAINLDKAIFDKKFLQELQKNVHRVDEPYFVTYIRNSSLTKQRTDALLLTLDELKNKNVQK